MEWFLTAPVYLYLCDDRGGLALGGTVRATNTGLTKVIIFPLRVRTVQLNCISRPVVPWNGVMRWEVQSHSTIRAPFYFSLFQYWRVTFFIIHVPGKWILSLCEIICWESPHDATSACALSIVTLLCQILLRYPTSRRCLSWAQFNNNMVYLIKTVNCYLFFIYFFSHGTCNINLTLVSYVDFEFLCSLIT